MTWDRPNPMLHATYVAVWDAPSRGEADPLPAAVRARVDALIAERNVCPEARVEAIDADLVTLLAPYAIDPLAVVRRLVGRRTVITRVEMAAILRVLAAAGLDLRNSYVPATIDLADQRHANVRAPEAWAALVRDITCVSVDARGRLRDGDVRYDEPGRLDPTQHAQVTFVPADIDTGRTVGGSTIAYLRRHADRVLRVRA